MLETRESVRRPVDRESRRHFRGSFSFLVRRAKVPAGACAVNGAARTAGGEEANDGLVPGFFVQSVLAALKVEGVDVSAQARRIGRDLSASEAALLSIPGSAYMNLLHGASLALRNPWLGLLLGPRLTESSLHMLGPIIVASPTLRSAFESIDALHVPMLSGQRWKLTVDGREALYGPATNGDGSEGSRIATDLVLALAFSCACRFVGPKHEDSVKAYFSWPAPENAPYQSVFHHRVVFRAPRSAIGFPRALLDAPRAGTDATFANTLCKLALARFAGADSEQS
jgi:hypothetical protein